MADSFNAIEDKAFGRSTRILHFAPLSHGSFLVLWPTFLAVLQQQSPRDLGSLDAVFYGAAPMSPDKLVELRAAFGDIFIQAYCSTEAPGAVSALPKRLHRSGDEAEKHRLSSAGLSPTAHERRERLACLRRLLDEGEAQLCAAVSADFGLRSPVETRLTDFFLVRSQLELAHRKLGRWMRKRSLHTPLYLWPGRSHVQPQPLGVVGVAGTWNYPIATRRLL